MDTALRIGGAMAGSKFGPIGTITGFFSPELIDGRKRLILVLMYMMNF